jgi:hypothetical protein
MDSHDPRDLPGKRRDVVRPGVGPGSADPTGVDAESDERRGYEREKREDRRADESKDRPRER